MTLFVESECLDDLIQEVHTHVLSHGIRNTPTKGVNLEILGAHLVLLDPIRRASRTESRSKIISCLGELLWYLSAQNDLAFISHYIPKYKDYAESNGIIHGGYGPRLFNMHKNHNQLENIITLLKKSPTTRRAVIQLFDASDIFPEDPTIIKYKDIPCTVSLQFIIRDNKLHLFVSMRSNDAFKGLTHDIFAFTMLQEFVSKILNCELGKYHHFVSSLHIYEDDFPKIKKLQQEGFMSTKPIMSPMPKIRALNDRLELLEIEKNLRKDINFELDTLDIDKYWIDIFRIIKIHGLLKLKEVNSKIMAKEEISKFSNKEYEIFFEGK